MIKAMQAQDTINQYLELVSTLVQGADEVPDEQAEAFMTVLKMAQLMYVTNVSIREMAEQIGWKQPEDDDDESSS